MAAPLSRAEAGRPAEPGAPPPAADVDAATATAIEALRKRGAAQLDAVRFHFIEALARRTAALHGAARPGLDRRLAQALAACSERVDEALAEADRLAETLVADRETNSEACSQAASGGPLAGLLRHIEGQGAVSDAGAAAIGAGLADAAPPAELKALRQSRGTWTRLSVDRQLALSLEKAPDNPGPLNSQHLVLRALQLMQALSPAYLARFVAQAETLLWLEQAGLDGLPLQGKAGRRGGDRRSKPGHTEQRRRGSVVRVPQRSLSHPRESGGSEPDP